MKFEVYREGGRSLLAQAAGDWRWRLRGDNGRIIATSGEGYQNKADCLHGIELVISTSVVTIVYDESQGRVLGKTILGGWS
ncbi:YegP family protein [Stenotrophomonas muris]|uniref:YegP family protein n=1 Tax=Stenotrophomonas muris TaxID=2963283 RepID=UPI003839E8C8